MTNLVSRKFLYPEDSGSTASLVETNDPDNLSLSFNDGLGESVYFSAWRNDDIKTLKGEAMAAKTMERALARYHGEVMHFIALRATGADDD